MNLASEVLRLRLDLAAVEISRCLGSADVPHALLKGPSTSLWLYDPPRGYRDVDLLVPPSALPRAQVVLREAGLATPAAGRPGEESPHSLLLRSAEGFEIDVHVSLPTVPPGGDLIWTALAGHLEELDLGVGRVPVLDAAGRCLTLALHALNNGPESGQPIEDLVRARGACSQQVWSVAAELARSIGAADLFRAGVALAGPADGAASTARAHLYASRAPSSALGLERLASARRRDLPLLVWRELIPTRGFLFYADPELPHSARAVARARLRRVVRLLRELPGAARAYRSARLRHKEPARPRC